MQNILIFWEFKKKSHLLIFLKASCSCMQTFPFWLIFFFNFASIHWISLCLISVAVTFAKLTGWFLFKRVLLLCRSHPYSGTSICLRQWADDLCSINFSIHTPTFLVLTTRYNTSLDTQFWCHSLLLWYRPYCYWLAGLKLVEL